MTTIYAERVAQLRDMMALNGWDAVVIGGSDPHSSEYPAPRWRQVEWLVGFTAEAGDVVITADHVGLWTDSRYFIQAIEQLEVWDLVPREVYKEIRRKHIFTHIQWDMKGIYLEVAEPVGPFTWLTAEQIRQEAALPTAFRQFWEEEKDV